MRIADLETALNPSLIHRSFSSIGHYLYSHPAPKLCIRIQKMQSESESNQYAHTAGIRRGRLKTWEKWFFVASRLSGIPVFHSEIPNPKSEIGSLSTAFPSLLFVPIGFQIQLGQLHHTHRRRGIRHQANRLLCLRKRNNVTNCGTSAHKH